MLKPLTFHLQHVIIKTLQFWLGAEGGGEQELSLCPRIIKRDDDVQAHGRNETNGNREENDRGGLRPEGKTA